jgi:hypothetical protein
MRAPHISVWEGRKSYRFGAGARVGRGPLPWLGRIGALSPFLLFSIFLFIFLFPFVSKPFQNKFKSIQI